MFTDISRSFFTLALELTVLFAVLSFVISLIQGLVPYDRLNRILQDKHPAFGVTAALILAFVTPFCSCSTVPVIVNLLHKQVRFGIVMVFLFASPVLDPIILTLMAVLLGVKVTVAYTIITAVLSVVIGLLLEKLGFASAVKTVVMSGYEETDRAFSFQQAMKNTGALLRSVYPFLLLGALIGSVIHGAVPTTWISSALGGEQWWLVPLAAIIGIPLYIRLSTMIPLSHMLLLKGMAIAPVMALMISSAGASLPELTLLSSIFQKRLVAAFVLSVVTMASASGFLFYFL